jgi:uncharacterized protein (TIGR03437 family)
MAPLRFGLFSLLIIPLVLRAEKPLITSAGKGWVAGGLFRIAGKSLAAEPRSVEETPWPEVLGGTSLQIVCGESQALAALRSVAEDSIEGQLPYSVTGACLLKVVSGGEESSPVQVEIAAIDARIATDEGSLAVFYRHFTDTSPLRAAWARPGRTLHLALTGLGAVSPEIGPGQLGGVNERHVPAVTPLLRLGETQLEVTGVWLSPTVMGQYLAEFTVPEGLAPGNLLLALGREFLDSKGEKQIEWTPAAYLPVGAAVEEIATAEIGPDGGAIGDGEFAFVIPPKVLEAPATLRLCRPLSAEPARAARTAGEMPESGLKYVIEGVPPGLAVGPGLSLRSYPPELERGGTVILRVGPNNEVHFEPVKTNGNGLQLSDKDFLVPGYSDTEIEFAIRGNSDRCVSAEGHFVLFSPTGCQGRPEEILKAAEAAYRVLGPEQGLDWNRRARWPVRITLEDFGAGNQRWGEHVPNRDRNLDYLRLNSRMIDDAVAAGQDWLPSLKATVGHELFHLMQHIYDPRSDYSAAKFPGAWFWMMEALSTWAEGVVVGDPDYIAPSVRRQDWIFFARHGLEYPPPLSCSFSPLQILWPDECARVQNHGYGASLLLRYLMANGAPPNLPGLLIERMAAGDGPVQALQSVAAVGSRWDGFVRSMIETGFTPHRAPSISDLLTLGEITFTPKHGQGDEARFFRDTIAIPDLSVRFYRVRFFEELKSPRTPFFVKQKQDGPLTVLVYQLKPDAVTLLRRESSRNTIVNDATALSRERAVLLVAVVNSKVREPYTASWLAELEIGAGAPIAEVLAKMSRLSCTVSANINVTREQGQPPTATTEIWQGGFSFALPGLNGGTNFRASGTIGLTGSGLAVDFDERDRVPVQVDVAGNLQGEENPVIQAVEARYTREASRSSGAQTLKTKDDVKLTIQKLPLYFSSSSTYYWEDSTFVDFRETYPFRSAGASLSGTTRRLTVTGSPPVETPSVTFKYNQFDFSSGNIVSCRFSK